MNRQDNYAGSFFSETSGFGHFALKRNDIVSQKYTKFCSQIIKKIIIRNKIFSIEISGPEFIEQQLIRINYLSTI